MKKIILTIITGLVLFVASLSAAVVVNNKIKNTKYDLIVDNSAGGSVVVDIDGEKTDVPSGEEKTILVKRKTKVKLSATADKKYNFAGWKIGSSNKSSEEITLTITSKTEVKAKYESKAVNVTVDGETLSYGIANNLLEFLQQAFPADAGYTKSYFIGNTKITETTEISEDTEITSKQEVITYYVTFMHNDNQVGEKVPYTVENKNVVAPTLPSEAGYSLTWPDITNSLNELKDFSVYSVKTPIEYTATFKYEDEVVAEIKFNITNKDNLVAPAVPAVAAGYKAEWAPYTLGLENATIQLVVSEIEYTVTFIHDNKQVGEKVPYTVNNKNITAPAVPTVEGYTVVWEEFSLEDKLENIVVNSIKTATVYTVTFKHNGEIIATEEYTIEDKNITVPAVPTVDGYTVVWENFSLDNLGNIVVNSVKNVTTYTVTFKHNGETVATAEYSAEDRTITVPAVPVETGYDIKWNEFSIEDKLENIVVNSVKTAIKYTVTFKHSGETVATEEYTVENKNITVPAVPESTDAYDYSWPQVTIPDTLGNIVVESIGTAKEFSITYIGLTDEEIGTLDNKKTYTCETETFTLTNPSRSGYTFIGWTENDGTNKELSVTIAKGSFGNKTYTAHWEEIQTVIKLGDLTASNVAKIYYGTNASEINTKLTTEGFKADPEKTYYFRAEEISETENQYYVVRFILITNSKGLCSEYNESTGFSFADEDETYTITAQAEAVLFSAITFENTGIGGTGTEFFDLWLTTATREDDELKYSYLDDNWDTVEASISIKEYLESIYKTKDNNKVITEVRFIYSDSSFVNKGVSSAAALIRLFNENTEQTVTVRFTYSDVV